jgi:hypothetical protein
MMTISATAPGGDMGPDPMAKRDEDGAGWPKQYRKGFLSLQWEFRDTAATFRRRYGRTTTIAAQTFPPSPVWSSFRERVNTQLAQEVYYACIRMVL